MGAGISFGGTRAARAERGFADEIRFTIRHRVCFPRLPQPLIGQDMTTPRLKVPVLPESATIDEAIKQMRAHKVSASAVKVGDTHHLLDFETVVAWRREPSLRTQSVAALVHGRVLPQ